MLIFIKIQKIMKKQLIFTPNNSTELDENSDNKI